MKILVILPIFLVTFLSCPDSHTTHKMDAL